ncbi:uncharacterized protein LOC142328580 [Lycorma delicatula]|uniref:uncharacterized protein LOC142328580 n=1 Tax=Lycorma delicatula TaxID=130591 RepID=UPI003F50D4A1
MDNIFDSFQAELKDLGEGKEDWWNNNLSDITEDEEDNEKDNGGTEINFLKKQKEEEEEDADDSKTDVRPESPELKRSFKKLKKMKFSNVLKLVDGTSNKVNSDLNQTCKTITSKNKSGSSESNDIGSNIQSLVGEQNEFSWSSTLASPLSTSVVNYSNLNSEEKQTLIPTCFNTAETSELFTSDYNESKCSDMCDNSVVKYRDYNTGNKQVFLDEINDEVEDCISETCNKQPVGFEKKCSRKLRFSSPKGQVRHSKDVKNMDRCLGNNLDKTTCEDLSDKDSSPDINILENFVSPISRTLMQNLDKDENFGSNKFRVSEGGITYSGVINENFNTHCQNNENYIKSSAKIFDSSSSNKSNVDNLSADLSISPQDQSNDISLRALEEICQASEILTTSCYSSTPLSSKKFVKNICTSTPIDESYKIIERKKCVMNKLNENKLENYSVKFKVPNKSPLKIVSDTEKKLSTDSLPEPSDKVNTLITLSHEPMKNSLSIYSILSRNITPSCNCKSLNDVLLSAKLLEDAECNRSSSQYIKKNKNALNEIIDKGNGFLQFNSLEMLESETSKLNDVKSLLISKIKIADDKYHLSNQYNDEEMLSKRFNHISNVMSTRNCDITNYSEVTDTQMFRIGEEAESNDTCSKYSISDTQMFRAVEEIDNILEVVNNNNDDINNIFDEKEIKESTNYIKSNSEKSCVNREPTLKKNHFKHEDPTENSTCSTIPYNKPDISNGKSHNSLKTFKISKLNEDCMTMEESFIEKNFIDSEFTQLSTFENLGNECLNDKKIIEKDKCLQVLSSNETKNITEDVSLKQKLYFGYNLLNDYSVEDGHEKLADRNEHSVDKCSVFFTASGKSVKVSDEALFKVRNMFFGSNELICRSDSSENSKKSVSCELSNLKTLDSCSHITSHNHCDFSTASGKQVNISEDALLKAKQLLSEDSLKKFEDVSVSRSVIEETLPKNTKVKTFDIVLNKSSGFTTASGNKVNISKEALLKAKKFLETEIDYSESVDKLEEKIPKKGEVNNFAGFLATSEKCVNLSKEPVSKAKNLFENNDGSSGKSHELKTVAVHKKEYPSNFAGFSTASGKSVRISKEALSEAKKLFAEFNINNGGSDESKESIQHKNEDCNFFGFSSDCGQTTSLSKGALLKAKEDEENNDNSGSSNKLKGITHNKIKDIGNFSGFSTASGKSVSVSEESLLKVKKLFAEDNDNSGFTDELKESTLHSGKGVNNFNGFSTAGGKSINVSKKSLTNARKLFEDIAKDKTSSELKEQVHYRDEILNNFVGFSTTSGKSISLSKDALSEARKLFKDNTEKFESSTHFKENVLSHFDDFSNIDRKSIGISGKLLSNVGKLFEGDGEKSEMLVESKGKTENSFVGFSTASGKSVNVSKEALLKVKNLFADDNSLNDLSVLNKNCTDVSCKMLPDKKNCKSFGISGKLLSNVGELFEVDGEKSEMLVESKGKTENSFVGFSTASGKSVNVSKEALLKVKNLFADDNSLNDLSVLNKNCTDVSCQSLPDKKICKSFGFSTASGKSVIVSKNSLLRAKKIFEENNSSTGHATLLSCGGTSCLSVGNKTTEESCSVNGIIKDYSKFSTIIGNSGFTIKENFSETNRLHTESSTCYNKVFSTASGKPVNVSDESLSKVKNLFTNEDVKLTNIDCCSKNEKFTVSQRTATKSHKMSPYENTTFSNVNEKFPIKFSNCVSDSSFEGFKTANNKSIAVSNEALLKAKQLFMNENDVDFKLSLASIDDCQLSHIGEQLVPEISGNKFNITYDTKKNNFDPVTHLEKCDAENCRSSVFDEDVSLSFVHEISESAAAFLFDEDKNASDVPEWVQTFVTSPSCLNDRNMTKISPIISNEANESVKRKRVLSPVLGSNDRFKKKRCNAYKSLKKSSFLNNESPVNSKGGIFSRLSDSNASFKTSTPLNTDKINKKRLICDKSFSLPVLKKLKMVDNEIFSQEDGKLIHALDIAEGRRIAAEQQNDFILKYKNKELTKQCKGSLLFRKTTEKRISLFEYVHGMLPKKYSRQQLLEMGVKKSVIDVTSNNAVNFRFKASDYYDAEFCDKNIEGLPIGDGAMLILDGAGTAGIQEITRAFFASPNVCPSLISHQWVQNHYRWITWKLASMERSFPTTFTNVCLTPHNVMLQLKYRYDREIDACQRSALRKLLESDESSARRMVVCVSDISNVVEKNEIDLSDGWYSITTIIDNEMVELINRKKVVVGTKLIIQGAELINNDQGCDPLQVGENVRLRLHTNSARRVRWNTRLGFCKHSGPLPERLDSVLPKGGVIGRLDAIIARSYPLVYMKKSDDGKNVFLGMKAEERESRLRQQKIQQQIETVYSQIQKEVDSEKRKSNKRCYKQISSEEFQSILSPGKLIGITENSPDLCGILSKEQRDIIDKFYCEEREKMQQSLQERLKEQLEEIKQQTSIPLLKLRLVDHLNPSCRKWKSGILSIWKPSEDLQSYLSEGAVVSISNVLANGSRNGELQLNAGCQVKYSVKSHSDAVRRNVSPLSLLNDVTFKPQFMELDVVGIVIHIETLSSLQTAYITDSSKYLLGISFWGSIKDFGWEKIVSQGSFIACCNLQWRSGTASWHIPCAHVTEVSYFTLNPKHDSLCNAMKCLKKDLVSEDLSTLILESQEKLFFLLKQRESGGLNLKSNKISMDLVNSHNNSSDLICESLKSCNESFIATNVSNDAAMSNKKASLINQKLKKLESYGKPPPITELPVAVLSPLAKKQFKLPICRNNNNELKDSSTFTMANVSKNR